MIESTCVYLQRPTEWLFLLRNKKRNDLNAGYWIGVGGKRKKNESVRACAVREGEEETGFGMQQPVYCGTIYFETEASNREKITLYTCTQFTGTMHASDEGTLAWIRKEDILSLPLWAGDRIFLQRMLHESGMPFTMRMIYDRHGNLVQWTEMEPEDE